MFSILKQIQYLKPDQKPPNIKIPEHQNALICSKTTWTAIQNHLHRKQFQIEALEREKAMNTYLKEGSSKMKKLWLDSVENLAKRRFDNIREKRKHKKLEEAKRFAEILEENEAERQKLLEKIRQEKFQQNYHIQNINRAAFKARVLFERDAQIAFRNKIRETERQKEKLEANENYVEKFIGNEIERVHKQKSRNHQYRAELKNQIAEIHQRNQIEQANQRKKEREELQGMKQEEIEDAIEQYHARRRKQHELRVGIFESKCMRQQLLNHLRHVENEDNRRNEIFVKYKNRIKCTLNKNAQIERQKIQDRAKKFGQSLLEQTKDNKQRERERLERSAQEKEHQYLEQQQINENAKQKLTEELKEYYKMCKERDRITKEEEEGKKCFDLLNRMKNVEMNEEHLKKLSKQREDAKRAFWADLYAQQQEKQRKQNQKREEVHEEFQHTQNCLRRADDEIMAYAEDVINENKSRNYPTFPIEKVVWQFKLDNGYEQTTRYKRRMANIRAKPSQQKAGRRFTKPEDDPTFGRCHCYKDRLFH